MAYIKILCCNVDPQPLLMNYGVTNQILCHDADPYHLHLRVVTTLQCLVSMLYIIGSLCCELVMSLEFGIDEL